jgi:PLP dependent protein
MALASARTMATGCAPSRRLRRCSGEQQHQPPAQGDAPYPVETVAPFGGGALIIAKQHAGTARQTLERRPQPLALTRIGDQQQRGEGVAAAHRASYRMVMADDEDSAAGRLGEVRTGIARAAALARRDPGDVMLIAVSKMQGEQAVAPLLAAGHRLFGESRVQEVQAKWPPLRERYPDVALHLVGQLQSNKAADAVALFDAIQSVDRPSLVTALAAACVRAGRQPLLFVQINIAAEPQKGGCAIGALPALLDQCSAAGLVISGLMCVPPADLEPAPYFALLAKLADRHGLPSRSMGMSDDYETAVMLGATHVRIGTALFGARP